VAANARALTHWATRLSAIAFRALKELRAVADFDICKFPA
jgi:hypothetical protein